MKQIVDKLNKIAQAIDESVELPTSDLIIDSLDAITTAFGGTPNDSNLIVDKLEDIAGVAHGGSTPTGTITITENTEPGSPLDIAQYRYADVSVSGGEVTNTYKMVIGDTYESELVGGQYGCYLYSDVFVKGYDSVTLNINGNDVVLTYSAGQYVGGSYTLKLSNDEVWLMVPDAGNYIITDFAVTLTGKEVLWLIPAGVMGVFTATGKVGIDGVTYFAPSVETDTNYSLVLDVVNNIEGVR